MSDAVIVDTGGANIASLRFALARIGCAAEVTRDLRRIERASHVILPGVGSAPDAMERLEKASLARGIPGLAQPVLGICLGMQLLFESSEEGDTPCLGVIPGRVRRLIPEPGRPVPHMGWNGLSTRRPHALMYGVADGDPAYFVHSYRAPLGPATVASCEYGEAFSAVVSHRNFCGAQFHPERSARVGSRFLSNFLEQS